MRPDPTEEKLVLDGMNKSQDPFEKYGKERGLEITKVVKTMHPDANVVDIYRGAIVVLPKTTQENNRGSITLIVYNDPVWKGEPIDEEHLDRNRTTIRIAGQKDGPSISVTGPHKVVKE